jgi:hypothetical protein
MRTAGIFVIMVGLCGWLCLTAVSGESRTFDPKSAPKTAAWIIALWQPIHQAIDNKNEAAQVAHEKKMDAALMGARGAAIDWTIPVKEIRAAGLGFEVVLPGDKTPHVMTVCTRDQFNINDKIFAIEPHDWVLALKPGDPVRIEGKVIHVHRVQGAPWRVAVAIGDYRLSPVNK